MLNFNKSPQSPFTFHPKTLPFTFRLLPLTFPFKTLPLPPIMAHQVPEDGTLLPLMEEFYTIQGGRISYR